MQPAPGRVCPVSYRYGAAALRRAADLRVDSLWVAGGLYGNPLALQSLLDQYESDKGEKALLFNGDFHWFDIDPRDFELVNETVLAFHALRGNVETELAEPAPDAGCGCAYPDWVEENTVERSNRIIEQLRATAATFRDVLPHLSALPMHLRADIGDARIAVVHGDGDSLAGWNFSQEALATSGGQVAAETTFDTAGVDVFASSHTCLPVMRRLGSGRMLVNNGAAGMPNFRGQLFGLATRIALSPCAEALYSVRSGGLHIEAIPLRYDTQAWERRFLAQWPDGTDAHLSYFNRIRTGPDYSPRQALRVV